MTTVKFEAAPASDCLSVDLPPFTALYHRPSGITHLLAEPAPDILTALADGPLSLAALHRRLAERFDVEGDALATRLDELVAAGLVVAT